MNSVSWVLFRLSSLLLRSRCAFSCVHIARSAMRPKSRSLPMLQPEMPKTGKGFSTRTAATNATAAKDKAR